MGNEINRDSAVYFDNGVPLADGSTKTSPSVATRDIHAIRVDPRVFFSRCSSISFLLALPRISVSLLEDLSLEARKKIPVATLDAFSEWTRSWTWLLFDRSVFERVENVTSSISYRSLSTIYREAIYISFVLLINNTFFSPIRS